MSVTKETVNAFKSELKSLKRYEDQIRRNQEQLEIIYRKMYCARSVRYGDKGGKAIDKDELITMKDEINRKIKSYECLRNDITLKLSRLDNLDERNLLIRLYVENENKLRIQKDYGVSRSKLYRDADKIIKKIFKVGTLSA